MDALDYQQIDQVRQRFNKGWPLDGTSLLPAIDAITTFTTDTSFCSHRNETTHRDGSLGNIWFNGGRMAPLGWVSQHAQGGQKPKLSHASSQMAWMVAEMKLYCNRSAADSDFAAETKRVSGNGVRRFHHDAYGQLGNFSVYLFNISRDPTESVDLSKDSRYQAILANMTVGLHRWIKTVQHSRTSAETNCNEWDPQFPS